MGKNTVLFVCDNSSSESAESLAQDSGFIVKKLRPEKASSYIKRRLPSVTVCIDCSAEFISELQAHNIPYVYFSGNCAAEDVVRAISDKLHDSRNHKKLTKESAFKDMTYALSDVDPLRACGNMLRAMTNACGADGGCIRFMNEDGDFPYAASIGYPDELEHSCRSLKPFFVAEKGDFECICGGVASGNIVTDEIVYADNGGILIEDMSSVIRKSVDGELNLGNLRGTCFLHGFRSQILIPVHVEKRPVGLLQITSFRTAGFDENDLHFAEQTADLWAVLFRRIVSERSISAISKKMKFLEKDLNGGVWEFYSDREYMTFSDGVYDLLGVDSANFEPTMQNFISCIHEPDRASVSSALTNMYDKDTIRLNIKLRSGRKITLTGTCQNSQPGVRCILGSISSQE